MKITLDADDKALDALADLLAAKVAALLAPAKAAAPSVDNGDGKTGTTPAKPAAKAAAPKAADKPAPAPKAADKPTEGAPTREDVHKALRDYSGPKDAADYEKRKNAALDVLRKHSPTLAELPVDKYQTVLDGLKALDAPKAADEDEFL